MFDFWEHCLFCGEKCQVVRPQKNPNRWREAYLCRIADMQKEENWRNDVSFRTHSALSDLHAADARYHKDCMSKFFSDGFTAFTQSKRDGAVEELIKQLNQDPSRIWNSVQLHKQYEVFLLLLYRLLINYLRDTLHPDMLVLSSPGMASIVMFRRKASTFCIVDDADDDCNFQAVSSLASKIRSHIPAHMQHRYHLTQLQGDAVKLFWHYWVKYPQNCNTLYQQQW